MNSVVLLLAIVALSTGAPINTDTNSIEARTPTQKPPIILAENQYLIEFEDFAKTKGWENDTDRTPQRSGASNYKSLHLYKSESISVSFCVPIEQEISISNIYFSNDGWIDNLAVKVDGDWFANFKSADSSNWGYLWNRFNYTGQVGGKMNLPSGRHELTIIVEDGDEYGVELDAIKFEFSRPDLTLDLKCPEETDNPKDKTERQNYPELSRKTPVSSATECSSAECKATPMSATDESSITSNSVSKTPDPNNFNATYQPNTSEANQSSPTEMPTGITINPSNPDRIKSTATSNPGTTSPKVSSVTDNSKFTDPNCVTPNCKSNPSTSDNSNPTESLHPDNTKATDSLKPKSTNPTMSSNADSTKPTDKSKLKEADCETPECKMNPNTSDSFKKTESSTPDKTNALETTNSDGHKSTESSVTDSSKSTDYNCVTPNCKSNPSHSDISNPTKPLSPDNIKATDSSKPESTKPTMSSTVDSTHTTESYKPVGTSNPDCESPDCKMNTKLLNTDSNTVGRSISDNTKPTESVVTNSRIATMSPVTDSSKPTETSDPDCETLECKMNPSNQYKSKPTISSTSDSIKSTASSNSDSTEPTASSNSDSTKYMEPSNRDKVNPTETPKSDSPKPTANSKPTDPNCLTPECESNPSNADGSNPTESLSPNSSKQIEPTVTGSSKTTVLDCETPDCKTNQANSDSSKPINHDNTKPTMLSVTESSNPTDASNSDCETSDCKKGRSNPEITKPTDSSISKGRKPTESLNTETNELTTSPIAGSPSTSKPTPNPDCDTLDCKMISLNPTNSSHAKPTVASKPECETLDCKMGPSDTKNTTSMNKPVSSDCKTADCTTDSSSSDITKTTETSITNSSPEKDEEIYKISCPKQKLLTVRRNDYLGCADDGKLRFDIYGAAVSEVTFVVPHPFVPAFPPKRHIFKRSPQTNVLWEDGYPLQDCSLGQTNPINENIDISRAAADGSLPITIFPKSTPSMNLAFKLTSTGLNTRKRLRPVFTVGACCTDPSNISLTAIETDSNTVIELGEQEFQFEDTIKSWIFPFLSDWDDRNVEVKIDFSMISQPIILNYMKFEIQEMDSTANDSPVSPPKTLLCETKEVKVEGLQEEDPNKKKLKFRLNGSQTTSEVSSLVFSPSGIGQSQTKPALVIDQSGYCSFNPQSPVNVTDSVAFILGSTDPTSETPRLAIDEVELEPDVNSDNTSIILHLLGSEFGRTTVQLKITETETRLTLLQIVPVGKPLSSFFLPCSGEATITADGADDISVRKPWKSISGEQFTIKRR